MPKNDVWYQLDNAAKIFPAISDDRNTNVYRITCELVEQIDLLVLQESVEKALQHFSYFRVVMRRGLFWFYLEPTQAMPQVIPESERVCARIFYKNVKDMLFRISYFRNHINLEVFHAIADGSGALELLRSVVYYYIMHTHRDEFPTALPVLDKAASPASLAEDGFDRHYTSKDKRAPFRRKAFTITGTLLPNNSVGIISAHFPTGQMLALAKSKGVTVTAYLAAITLLAVYRELMPKRAHHKDIGVNVPVDLRGFFPTMTARNFFGVVDVRYNFGSAPSDLDSVLASVKEQFSKKVVAEELARSFNFNMSMQKNMLTRFVPLFLKNLVLKAAYHKAETATTCAVSNLGRIQMPDAFVPYIKRFSCFLNPTSIHRVKLCVCSFADEFVINFSSCIEETGVQRSILRHLAEKGVEVCITTNGGEQYEAM